MVSSRAKSSPIPSSPNGSLRGGAFCGGCDVEGADADADEDEGGKADAEAVVADDDGAGGGAGFGGALKCSRTSGRVRVVRWVVRTEMEADIPSKSSRSSSSTVVLRGAAMVVVLQKNSTGTQIMVAIWYLLLQFTYPERRVGMISSEAMSFARCDFWVVDDFR